MKTKIFAAIISLLLAKHVVAADVETPYFLIEQVGAEAPNVALIFPQNGQSLPDNFWGLCHYRFEISDGINGLENGGAKMLQATALTAFATGKRIKVTWDNNPSTRHHCYIKSIVTEP